MHSTGAETIAGDPVDDWFSQVWKGAGGFVFGVDLLISANPHQSYRLGGWAAFITPIYESWDDCVLITGTFLP